MNVSNKTYIIIALVLLIVIAVLAIAFNSNNHEKEGKTKLDTSQIQKLELMREKLLNSKLNLDEIIPTNKYSSDKSKLIGYYHSYDCSSCVKKMMSVIVKIEHSYPSLPVYIISNELRDMKSLKKDTVEAPSFYDAEGKFKKWINYSYSPVLIYLDKKNSIREVFHTTIPIYEEGHTRLFMALDTIKIKG